METSMNLRNNVTKENGIKAAKAILCDIYDYENFARKVIVNSDNEKQAMLSGTEMKILQKFIKVLEEEPCKDAVDVCIYKVREGKSTSEDYIRKATSEMEANKKANNNYGVNFYSAEIEYRTAELKTFEKVANIIDVQVDRFSNI